MKGFLFLPVVFLLINCTNKQSNNEVSTDMQNGLPSPEDKAKVNGNPEEEVTIELLNYDSTNAEMKYAKNQLNNYFNIMRNFGVESATIIGSYGRYYEHSKEVVSYNAYDQYKMLQTEDAIYEEYDKRAYFLFKNDTLVASGAVNDTERDPQSDKSGYTETFEIYEKGLFVSGERSSNGEIRNISFRKYSPSSVETVLDYSNLLAKFDPRLPEQEMLGEPSEEDLLREAKEDSIRQLTHVNLENSNLSKLPTPITIWNDVTHINLSSNNLSSFPVELKQIVGLVSLNLSENKLSKIPQEISAFENLEELYLDNNLLTSLPREIINLKKLKYLSLANNEFSSESKREILTWFSKTTCVVSFIVLDENLNPK